MRKAVGHLHVRSRLYVLDKIKLPVFKPDLNEPTIETTIELASKYGYIEEKPSLDDLIAP